MRRPLTCFLFPVLALCGIAARTAQAQISPGALSQAHSSLEGATNCTVCHDIGKISAGFKCLDCHKDIRRRLDAKKGLHPSLMAGERSGRACAACHLEHNGRNFALIRWDAPMKDFDHNRAASMRKRAFTRL